MRETAAEAADRARDAVGQRVRLRAEDANVEVQHLLLRRAAQHNVVELLEPEGRPRGRGHDERRLRAQIGHGIGASERLGDGGSCEVLQAHRPLLVMPAVLVEEHRRAPRWWCGALG